MNNPPKNERDPKQRGDGSSDPKKPDGLTPGADAGSGSREVEGIPESPASRETFPERTRRPGAVGLGNEARPGLGTRGTDEDAAEARAEEPIDPSAKDAKPRITTRSYEEPRPEPREQAPDSFAHEQERSSGVSGHSGNS